MTKAMGREVRKGSLGSFRVRSLWSSLSPAEGGRRVRMYQTRREGTLVEPEMRGASCTSVLDTLERRHSGRV